MHSPFRPCTENSTDEFVVAVVQGKPPSDICARKEHCTSPSPSCKGSHRWRSVHERRTSVSPAVIGERRTAVSPAVNGERRREKERQKTEGREKELNNLELGGLASKNEIASCDVVVPLEILVDMDMSNSLLESLIWL
ncbi:hypothetical protein L484_021415 [Morus notabilis]|uniref:Uncharacterized protein n=1 Tax=Morus notabilis TaxID=981085 RepID=W9S054_9ROSA|nr:hypothetical protein L484_021415 [Morus notabilis]